MPSNYTPVPGNAPAVITTPSDLDDATAESVNLAFRALADNLMGLTALLGQPNTFTAAPLAVNVTAANTAALVTQTVAGDDANSVNIWKAVLGFNVGTYYVNAYVGRTTGAQQFIVAVNAVWDPAAQHWVSDDHAHPSVALIWGVAGGLEISSRAAAVGSWTTWPTTLGDLTVRGTLSALAGAFGASGIGSTGSISTAGEHIYGPLKTRTSMMPTGVACIGGHNNGNEIEADGTRAYVFFSINLPHNATAGDIEVVHYQDTTTPSEFELMERTVNFAVPAAAVSTQVAIDTGPVATGYQLATVSVGFSLDPTKEYHLRWHPGSGSDRVAGIRMVNWQDNGPVNDL